MKAACNVDFHVFDLTISVYNIICIICFAYKYAVNLSLYIFNELYHSKISPS